MVYTVEIQYTLPVYKHITVEAASVEEAHQKAFAEMHNGPADWKFDYDNSSAEKVSGTWEGNTAYQGEPCTAKD